MDIAPAVRQHDLVFYDGGCGLCHRFVLFLLERDPDGVRFRYAPLEGETAARVLAAQRASLPDSVVVLTREGQLLVKSEAVRHVLRGLGGGWNFLSGLSRVVPRLVLDIGYDSIASVRKRLFRQPGDVCPIVPPQLRARFLP